MDLEQQLFENGLLIELIPEELKSEKVCINALKWALQIYSTPEFKIREEMCFRIMDSFPKQRLLYGYLKGHLADFE
jgi:hypothetical protein